MRQMMRHHAVSNSRHVLLKEYIWLNQKEVKTAIEVEATNLDEIKFVFLSKEDIKEIEGISIDEQLRNVLPLPEKIDFFIYNILNTMLKKMINEYSIKKSAIILP